VLTIDEIDPTGKIPEFKFCAVKVERAGPGEDFAESAGVREGAG
jgi:formate dehydrogenase major subunit